MDYIEIKIDLQGKPAFTNDIVVALLSELEFESFTEENRVVSAYIPQNLFNQDEFDFVFENIKQAIGDCKYELMVIVAKNWNKEWESQFEPVFVDDICMVRAPFHKKNDSFKYDIIIEPKMSFGTGHHETTYLVLKQMLEVDFVGKTVADCGCGTGVLGIMAEKLGASSVFAFDYDEWCYTNTLENVVVNNATVQEIMQGDMLLLEGRRFDVILANINRNILTSNMHRLAQSLNDNGLLLMSGFYEKDIPIVEKQALENNLKFVSFKTKNKWTITVFSK